MGEQDRRRARRAGWALLGGGVAFVVLAGFAASDLGEPLFAVGILLFVAGSVALAAGLAGGKGVVRVLAVLGLALLILWGGCMLLLVGGGI